MNTLLKAEERKITGRKIEGLRKAGILPGNIYGKKVKSTSVQVNLKDFEKVYKEAGETGIVELDLGKEKRPVLIHNIQKQPVTDSPIHVDFYQVNLNEKVTASVPVELTGEAPAEKLSVGTAVQYVNEIEVEALPGDLPDKFVVDISDLSEVDQAIHIKDIKYDKAKIEVKSDVEQIVVKVEPPQKEEVIAPVAPAEGELPAEGAVAPEGGETPAVEGIETSKEAPKEEQK